MLKDKPWFKFTDDIGNELIQAQEEGKSIDGFEKKLARINGTENDMEKQELAGALYDEIQQLPIRKDYKYFEPSDLAGIKAARPGLKTVYPIKKPGGKVLLDKVYGAWLGRCAGCLLGQPVEGWRRERLHGFLKETSNYPVSYYLSSAISGALRDKYGVADKPGPYGASLKGWINNISCMPEDDDTNYTVIGMKILENYGRDFTPDDVAECWLQNLPVLHVCTAERVAYRNLVNRIYPPLSASCRNPYREWIGAQIRADFFGYCTPGNPELGAEFAWRDASISHIKNGIYGEMFVAAMLSAAAVSSDVEEVILAGLSQIPERSRLAERIRDIMSWKAGGLSWEQAIDRIHEIYDENFNHDWCHTISNASIVCLGLLYGGLDFEKAIGTSVMCAFDTDCNGATVGSIVGMMLGAKALPAKWTEPLNDRLKSGVDGFGLMRISEMAKRTVLVINSSK